ncbi:MAG TPA: MBG domain-containing protein [Pirellulales bacterium]|nr:MBG domain-containing protein [Pirellulales bacterium]
MFTPRIEPLECRTLLSVTVATDAASSISATGATLHGSVNPGGSTATAYFQYSTNPSFTPTVEKTIGSGLNLPYGVAVDAAGDVFVADLGNNAIEEIQPDGTIHTIGSGFVSPSGVAVDADGDVFVADFGNNAVKEILPNGTIQRIDFNFDQPVGLAVDAAGNVFVADSGNNAIEEIIKDGPVWTVGSGFTDPTGVAVDAAGHIFVADKFFALKEFVPGGEIQTLGSGFGIPTSVAVDAAGDVFVTDVANAAVKEILPDGEIQTLGSGFSGAGGVAVDAAGNVFVGDIDKSGVVELSPTSVAATPATVSGSTTRTISAALTGLTQDTTYFYRAAVTDAAGTVVDTQGPPQSFTTPLMDVATQAANSVSSTGATLTATVKPQGQNATVTFQYSTDPSFIPTVESTLGSGFADPFGVAVDAAGDVFVADPGNSAVKEVLRSGTIQTLGSGFGSPEGVAVDAAGDVFVADFDNSVIEEILPGGTMQTLGSGFKDPTGVAVDAAGDVFVADYGNNAVKKILPSGAVQTLGSGFKNPTGVAVDASGDVFVADYGNNAVKEILRGGTIQTLGSGFSQPAAVAVDALGDVFVADYGNGAVKEILPGGTIQTLGSGFSQPAGVAVDAAGDVLVGDITKKTVVELSPPSVAATPATVSGSTSTTVSAALNGLTGDTTYFYRVVAAATVATVADSQSPPKSFTTLTPPSVQTAAADPVSATGATLNGSVNPNSSTTTAYFQYSTDATFTPTVERTVVAGLNDPSGVAVDAAGDVFVTDSVQQVAKEVSPNGTIKAIGSGYNDPVGVAVDGAGDVFVTDFFDNAVDEVLPNGTIKRIGSGFKNPTGIAVDAAGDVFVVDKGNNAVKEVLANGAVKTIATGFNNPQGVAVDTAGDVFVADDFNDAVKEVLPDGTIKTIGSGFDFPLGVAVDAAGDIFVADSGNNAVKEVLPSGTIRTIGSGINVPSTVAVDAAGDVFVANQGNSIVEISPPTVAATPASLSGSTSQSVSQAITGLTAGTTYYFRVVTTSAGGTVADSQTPPESFTTPTPPSVQTSAATPVPTGAILNGSVDPNGSTTTAYFQFSTDETFTPTVESTIGSGFADPAGVVIDADGDVFVADSGNNAIKEVLPNGTIKNIASGVSAPYGLGMDTAGDVFVADSGSNAVEKILPNGTITTVGSGFASPFGVAVDAAGDVFVADYGNNAVKEILPNGTIKTIGSGFNKPTGVTVDTAGDVFVADYGNNAVKEILPNGTVKILGSGFSLPAGVAVDAAGDVFVADSGNNAVKEILPNSTIDTIGSGFSNPFGVAVDAAGDVFVADYNHDRVVEFSPTAIPATPSPLSGSTTQQVSGAATGLTAGTTYYFRLVATGAGGTVTDTHSPPESFTAPSITWANPADVTYGTALSSMQLDANASIPGSFAYTLADGTTPASGAVLHAGQDQVLIATFKPTDSADYATETVQVEINVDPASLTITADDKSKVYGAALPTLTASYSGFVNADSPASLTMPPSLSTTATVGSHVSDSPYAITASGAVDADYTITYVAGSLTVTAAPLTITADDKRKVYGAALPALTASYSGFVNGDSAASLTTLPSLSTTATATSHVSGSPYTITASGAVDADYTIRYVPGELTVTPATLTVTANNASRAYGAPNPTFTDTIGGFVNGDASSVVDGAASLSTDATSTSRVGAHPIIAALGTLTAVDYAFAFQNGTLTVTQAMPVITWSNPPDITYGTPLGATQLDATANVPGTFSYTLADGKTPADGAILNAGANQMLNVAFTPTDTADFSAGSAQVEINVDSTDLIGVTAASATGGVEGVTPATLSGATFTDANTTATATDFTVTAVDWGDGSGSTSGLSLTGSGGNYTVSGAHLYAEDGVYQFRITVKDASGDFGTIAGTADVADAALRMTPVSVAATAGATFSGVVATFSDDNPNSTVGDFAVTIDWGDHTMPTTVSGSEITVSDRTFTVAAGHVYAEAGAYSLTVTVDDKGGSSQTMNENAAVASATTAAPTANPDTFVLGASGPFSGSGATSVLANDTSAGGQPQNLVATLVSQPTNGTLTLHPDGSFSYAPGATFQGIDRFTYQVSEGATMGNTVTVTLLSYHASLVDKLYHQVLHRSAEDSGLIYWTAQLDAGQPLDVVATGIFNSTERLDPLVTQFYEQYLDRDTDPSGLAYWVNDWQTEGDPRDVVENILASKEFFDDAGDTNTGFVELLYQRVLNRSAEQNGLDYWVGLMSPPTNETRLQIASQFYDTHEKHVDLVDFLFGEYFQGVSPLPDTTPYVTDLDESETETQVEKAIIDSSAYSSNPPEPAAGAVGRPLYPH